MYSLVYSVTPKVNYLSILAKFCGKIETKYSNSVLFHIKTRDCIKYFIHDYSYSDIRP